MTTLSSTSSAIKESWRPFAAYVYLLICICDFVVMPIYYATLAGRSTRTDVVTMVLQLKDHNTQIEALKILKQSTVWDPITLNSNGLFHISFGGILGISAWTRGQEKIENAKNQRKSDPEPGATT